MKKMFIAVLISMSFTLAAPMAQAQSVTDVFPSGGNGAWWVYRWGSTSGLIATAERKIKETLNCEGQGGCQAQTANEIFRGHFNIRTGRGPAAAHAYVDCRAMNAPVADGHILILSCTSQAGGGIGWNVCPIHISQNK